ncbi:hypothetical protein [Streptomyces sp. NPDC048142]|uniref:hypothetical protein n=1 Tax=Streptomyces sp. NPDC048142 TaxID=3365501 RepID=UPI003710D92F
MEERPGGAATGTGVRAGPACPPSGSAGATDRRIEAGDGVPGAPGAGQYPGRSVHFTDAPPYAGMAYGPTAPAARRALPIPGVSTGGAVAPATTHRPGTGRLPVSGAGFGRPAR